MSEGCEQIEISVEGNVAVVKLNRPERHNALGTRIAAEDAEFGFPEVGFGIVPGAGGTQRLPRLIDPTNAKELILTARRIDAETALGMGILSRVIPKDSILGEARALAEKMAKNSPLALACARAAIDVSGDLLRAGIPV